MNIYPQFEIMNNMKVKPILSQPHTFLVKILNTFVSHGQSSKRLSFCADSDSKFDLITVI